jgi:allophanate hydrolase
VVPACRSLDCVSIFALTCSDAAAVLKIAEGYDPSDPFSRSENDWPVIRAFDPRRFRFGVPRADQLQFFGDPSTPNLFAAAIERFTQLGGTRVEIDFTPFAQAACLLYEGPWLAERYASVKAQNEPNLESLQQITREIIEPGRDITAVDAFKAFYKLESLRQQSRESWKLIDCLLLPTTGTIYRCDQIAADPIGLNTNLGYYTNFTNLLDLSAVALPAGFGKDGMPRGVTIMARAGQEDSLLILGARFQHASNLPLGATSARLSAEELQVAIPEGWVQVGVLGAHLSGLPLNHQLTERGARLVRTCRTSPGYRFYALPGTVPPKPGLVRVKEGGRQIELEIWVMDAQSFGTFVAAIPPPLGIGTIELEDGSGVKGFLCEGLALTGATDISEFGGWRRYLAASRNG